MLLDLLYILLGVVTAPWWMRKARADWPARFGKGPPLPNTDRGRVLLHAVSVGEVNALRDLVPRLLDHDVVIAVGTDTGIARARQLYADVATVVRYPLDFSWSVRRFLDRTRPDVVALTELEVWPHFVRTCEARGIAVVVVNGRLSARSFKGYRRWRWAIGPTFRRLTLAAVQDEAYASRFRDMGVRDVRITGSMKWDTASTEADPGTLREDLGIGDAPLVVAGSTGPGEEALLHEHCPPGAILLCAPRHPERFDEAAEALPGCVRRSTGERRESTRYLLDTLGELRQAYAIADLVVIGRSYNLQGGSDPIEACALGRPVVIGPDVHHFQSVVQALEEAGALEIVTREALPMRLGMLLDDEETRRRMGEAGRDAIHARRGASERHEMIIRELVTRRRTSESGTT